MLEGMSEVQGIVARPHDYDVTCRVVLDSEGPFLWNMFAPLSQGSASIERDIRDILGADNVRKVTVGQWSEHLAPVYLELQSAEFDVNGQVYSSSPERLADEIKGCLPEEHVVSITVTKAVDLGGHGWRR